MDYLIVAIIIVIIILFGLTALFGFAMFAGTFVMVGAFFRRILKLAETEVANPDPAAETETAQVAGKRRQASDAHRGGNESFQHHITFRLADDDEPLEFQVTEAVYQSVLEGEVGTLTYQDSLFRSFVPDRGESASSAPPKVAHWTCAHCRNQVNSTESKCPSCGSATPEASVIHR